MGERISITSELKRLNGKHDISRCNNLDEELAELLFNLMYDAFAVTMGRPELESHFFSFINKLKSFPGELVVKLLNKENISFDVFCSYFAY